MREKDQWVWGSLIATIFFFLSSVLGRLVHIAGTSAGFALSVPSEYARFFPINLLGVTLSAWINILGAAGMFSMALAEANGSVPTLKDYARGLQRPFRYLPMAIATAVLLVPLTSALYFVLPAPWTSMALLPIELFFAPFYCFILPIMLTDQLPWSRALKRNLTLSKGNYFSLVWTIFRAFCFGYVGSIAIFIGLVLTLRFYHQTIVRRYRELTDEAPSPQSEPR